MNNLMRMEKELQERLPVRQELLCFVEGRLQKALISYMQDITTSATYLASRSPAPILKRLSKEVNKHV